MRIRCCFLALIITLIGLAPCSRAADAKPAADTEALYKEAIERRSDKIIAALDLQDTNTAARVRAAIMQQYFSLRKIHGMPDATAVGSGPNAQVATLHAEFLAKLAKDLDSAQIEKVKDGMTYGVVPLTYGVYLKMFPAMTAAEKQHIRSLLEEAREIAMDQGTSEEKHAVFNRYKGKINNYLSKAGYDARKGAENLKRQTTEKR